MTPTSPDLSWLFWLLIGLVALWALLIVVFWLFRPRDVSARELIRVVPDVVRLIRSVITDSGAPLDVRLVLVGLLIWILSPIDLIPEFIPGLGPLDDVIVAILSRCVTRDGEWESRACARGGRVGRWIRAAGQGGRHWTACGNLSAWLRRSGSRR